MSDFLTLGDLPAGDVEEWAVVEVPEFGAGKSVKVRALTVAEWTYMLRQAYRFTINGSEPAYNADYDEVSLAAAMCTYDDSGQRVFGNSQTEALQYVRSLHRKYRAPLARIHAAVMELSELAQPAEPEKKE